MIRSIAAAVERLDWTDVPTDDAPIPSTLGLGSGLTRSPRDPPGQIWAVTDRGPNLKPVEAADRLGRPHLRALAAIDGAKVLVAPDAGPVLAALQIEGDAVRLTRRLPLRTAARRLSGRPTPQTGPSVEQVFDLDGRPVPPDVLGADTECLARLPNGFVVGEEYAPSLLWADEEGVVRSRWVCEGEEALFASPDLSALPRLPPFAANRRLNRGIEALAASADGRWLVVMLQSGVQQPETPVWQAGRFTRLWIMDAASGGIAGQYLYPFDPPQTWRRDGPVDWGDLKVCECALLDDRRLLVMERVSVSTRFYIVDLAAGGRLLERFLNPSAPLESADPQELAAQGASPLVKRLLFSTDDHPEIGPDLEGMAVLSPRELVIASDNDFGVSGARTEFWRVRFDRPVLAED
jgi:hypothetical protein